MTPSQASTLFRRQCNALEQRLQTHVHKLLQQSYALETSINIISRLNKRDWEECSKVTRSSPSANVLQYVMQKTVLKAWTTFSSSGHFRRVHSSGTTSGECGRTGYLQPARHADAAPATP